MIIFIMERLHVHSESGRSFEVSAAVRKNMVSRRSKSRLQQMNSQTFPDTPLIDVPL